MSGTVRVPDRVKARLDREKADRGISRGAIVEEWMTKADKFGRLESDFLDEMQTRGVVDE